MCYSCSIMEKIGVAELRQNASVHLRRVAGGETFCITDRGQPVAVMIPAADVVRESVGEILLGLVRVGAYPDLDAALTAGVAELVRHVRARIVDEAVVKGYELRPQEPDPWVEEASSRLLEELGEW